MEASRDGRTLFSGFADRVIDAVVRGGMSRRGAAERFGISDSVAVKWVERFERTGLRTAGQMGGHKRQKLEPHRDFLEACHAEKPDVTLQALCDRLLAERGVKADTSLMSRFLRRIGDCQESCVRGHSDADGGRIWQSRKTPWTVCWRGVTRRLFSPRTGYSTS